MKVTAASVYIPFNEMQTVFQNCLLKYGLPDKQAASCATVFAESSLDGVYTHGVNRFPRFIEYIKAGYVKPGSVPVCVNAFNGMEQWDGQLGPGITNAQFATTRAAELATQYGIGSVALRNTNHWMRGGTYGWQAAKKGFIYIGFTNTLANMPAWGAKDQRLGNNPMVVALPCKDEAVVLDMALSQYSFGAMEQAVLKNEKLITTGGFDTEGNLTDDPSVIIASGRTIPVGYWKGAGLSLLLDILATVLSGGLSVSQISAQPAEYGLSQVFIAIDPAKLQSSSTIHTVIEQILTDYAGSVPENEKKKITYPGERVLQTRERNLRGGIPVLESVWTQVLSL
jgi:3-dehydro-L-gulonate 2-dehydrogenase